MMRSLIYSALGALFLITVGFYFPSIWNANSADIDAEQTTANNQSQQQTAVGTVTGLPTPRYVSLKQSRVNVRVGPGRNYALSWIYQKAGLPVEIMQEYDNWRRIRDVDGNIGWVYHALLSGRRTAQVAPWHHGKTDMLFNMYRNDSEESAIVARLEPNVIVNLRKCSGQWCEVDISKHRGWMKQDSFWGVYPDEVFD